MTDFIVDPTGKITDVRARSDEKQADAQVGSKKSNGRPEKVRNTRLFRDLPMSRIAIAGLVVALMIEIGLGVWLYREHEAIATAEKSIEQRESAVLSRETIADQREATNQAKSEKLASQEGSLKAMDARLNSEDTRLDSVEKDLKAKETELEEKDRVLAKREKDDEDDEDDQAFALAFVQDAFDRIRMQLERHQESGGGWLPEAHDATTGMPPDTIGSGSSPSLRKQIEQLEERYQQIEESKPEIESSVAGRIAALAELASECAELIGRGSIDSLQLQAGIEFELEVLRDLAVRLKLSEDAIPKNLYELLQSSRLLDLELLQTKKVVFLKERNTLFSGLYQEAIAEAESTLKEMSEAKAKRPSDPTPLFAKAILERKLSPADVAALRSATSGEARVAAINLRYSQLLQKQLAIRWWDVNVRQRMHDTLALLSPESQEQFRSTTIKLAYIDLLSASTPSNSKTLRMSLDSLLKSPETVGEAVSQFVSNRYSDPLRAAELYAMLEAAYVAENGEVVAPEDRNAFKEWLVGHLPPGKVYEFLTLRIEPLLGIFSDFAAINDPRAPHPDDRNEVEETRRALLTENARRPVGISALEARLNSRIPLGKPEQQRLYGILRVLADRAETPEIKIAWIDVALDGLSAQLDLIDKANQEARNAISKNGEAIAALEKFSEFEVPPSQIRDAELAIAKSYRSIELRLDDLRIESSQEARVQKLLTRVKEGYGPNPPPPTDLEGIKAASDFGDAFVVSQIRNALPKEIAAIATSTETIVARTQKSQKLNSLGRRLAELSFRVYPEGLPHELVNGKLPEHIKTASKEERIETWAGLFSQTMGERDIQNCIESLESTLLLRPKQIDQSKEFLVPVSILYDSTHGDGAFSKADTAVPTDAQRLRDVMKRVTYMGKDRVGREIFKVDGVLKAVNNHADGSTALCPVYIPQ